MVWSEVTFVWHDLIRGHFRMAPQPGKYRNHSGCRIFEFWIFGASSQPVRYKITRSAGGVLFCKPEKQSFKSWVNCCKSTFGTTRNCEYSNTLNKQTLHALENVVSKKNLKLQNKGNVMTPKLSTNQSENWKQFLFDLNWIGLLSLKIFKFNLHSQSH